MLVFSRKKNDSIIIGDNIEVKIISIGRDSIKLGITAPREVSIHRKEIYLAIEEENRAAAAAISLTQISALKELVQKNKRANAPHGTALKQPDKTEPEG